MVERKRQSGVVEQNRSKFVRGNEHRDYTIYTRLMDAALQAKAASLFPYFGDVSHGAVIVDAGSGTGALSELTAEYFRGAHVYALDISHELMERAENGRGLTQLVFGDAANQNFPANSVDIKFFSTSGHEVESYGGKGRMTDAVRATYDELKPGGRIVIRDFAQPSRKEPIYMQILTQDGVDDPEEATTNGYLDYNLLSTNALFNRFHQEFAGGNAFDFERIRKNGQEYIKIDPEWAHEFYLRKDYTANWRQEIHEKYSYWSPEQAEAILRDNGYTNVTVIPDPNAYILDNRLRDKIALFEENATGELREIPFPSTHMIVVGTKPEDTVEKQLWSSSIREKIAVDYQAAKQSMNIDSEKSVITIGERRFPVDTKNPAKGSKKVTYWMADDPHHVLKVARTDSLNDHAIFKAMYQSVEREDILREANVPHPKIIETDPQGPPYRYYLQEALTEGSQSAAELIKENALTETDIAQMASYVNTFELGKQWQLDTNPFNWYRVPQENGTTVMTYVDDKVYRYDEMWEFKKVGLLQWMRPEYIAHPTDNSAAIPKAKDYESLQQSWETQDNQVALWWKKYLHPSIQPESVS